MDVVNMQSLKLSHVTEILSLEYEKNCNILKMWNMENITEVPKRYGTKRYGTVHIKKSRYCLEIKPLLQYIEKN